MLRFAAGVFCALTAVAALAAPAPMPRPWVTGWEKPVDPRGDCKFERDGDRLTITVPGEGHDFNLRRGRLNAPRLLRDVEGDFVAQVGVGGLVSPAGETDTRSRTAGLLLTDGKRLVRLERPACPRTCYPAIPLHCEFRVEARGGLSSDTVIWFGGFPPEARPAYLRLERRGDRLRATFSRDGKDWERDDSLKYRLPRKLKVGVFAQSTAPGKFKATFDHFRLSRPGK